MTTPREAQELQRKQLKTIQRAKKLGIELERARRALANAQCKVDKLSRLLTLEEIRINENKLALDSLGIHHNTRGYRVDDSGHLIRPRLPRQKPNDVFGLPANVIKFVVG